MKNNVWRNSIRHVVILLASMALFANSAFACAALTKHGKPCKRPAAPGSAYCWQHGGGRQSHVAVQNGNTDTSDSNPTNRIKVKSFLGIRIGASAKVINGTTIKGERKAKLVTVHPFRQFKKATVTFSQDDRVSGIVSEYIMPSKMKKEDAFKEAESILKILETKIGAKFKPTGGRGAYLSVGAAIWQAPARDYIYSEKDSCDIRLTVISTQVENITLRGPGVPDKVSAWKIVLSFTARNTQQANWFEWAKDGIALP